MVINVLELINSPKILTNLVKEAQSYVHKNPFRVDAITIELYLHPMELQAELCRLALKRGRVSMYKTGHGATYRVAWYEEGQYHGLSYGYSNVKNFIPDKSIFGHDPAMLIPVRIFYNPNKASYYETLRSKDNLTTQEIMTLLGAGLLQTKSNPVKPYNPTYLTEMLTYFAKCTAFHARNLRGDEIDKPATVWKFKSGDIALDLPVPSELITVHKNVKGGEKTIYKELQGDGKYGYTLLDGDLKVYPKTSLGVKAMRESVNRDYRNVTQGIMTQVVGIPATKMFGNEKPEMLHTLLDRLLDLVYKYPVTRVERTFKKLDQEITFENGKMLTQTFNSLKGVCPDVVITNTTASKIDIVLQGARVMKTQVDRYAGEAPPTDVNRPLEIEAYKERESKRTPLTRTEIGNIKYLYSLSQEKRMLEIEQYSPSERYTIRNAITLLSRHESNNYREYNYNQEKFRAGALKAFNKFSAILSEVVNRETSGNTLDRVVDELYSSMEHVNAKFNEEHQLDTEKTDNDQLRLAGITELNKCLTAIIEAQGICGKYKYSKADLDDFVKKMEESDTE